MFSINSRADRVLWFVVLFPPPECPQLMCTLLHRLSKKIRKS